jgi:hypothetical protein
MPSPSIRRANRSWSEKRINLRRQPIPTGQHGAVSIAGGILNVSSGSLTILSSTLKGNKGTDIVSDYGYLSIDNNSTIGTVYSVH